MRDRPDRFDRRARGRRFAALLALILCAALVDVPGAWAKPSSKVTSVSSTAPKGGEGTVTKKYKKYKKYKICVPFFAIGVVHSYEIEDGTDVIDTLDYQVPQAEGTAKTETDNGVPIKMKTIHSGGLNGSPSRGCFTYMPE